jgi:hypothetical protein
MIKQIIQVDQSVWRAKRTFSITFKTLKEHLISIEDKYEESTKQKNPSQCRLLHQALLQQHDTTWTKKTGQQILYAYLDLNRQISLSRCCPCAK